MDAAHRSGGYHRVHGRWEQFCEGPAYADVEAHRTVKGNRADPLQWRYPTLDELSAYLRQSGAISEGEHAQR